MIRDVDALVFDMDGTLVDSEHLTRVLVDDLLRDAGLPTDSVDDTELHGVTWAQIAATLLDRHPSLQGRCTPELLHRGWHALWCGSPPVPVPGVVDALKAAKAAGLPLALATSSNGESARSLLDREGFVDVFDAVVTADDIQRSKPDPEIFLLAAERLGIAPARTLVFEDSLAGLRGAKAAGMRSVAVLLRSAAPEQARDLSARAIVDYRDLEPGFFEALRSA